MGISREDCKSLKFIFNAKNLNVTLSLAEAGISNLANIYVVETKGIKGISFPQNENNNDNQRKKINVYFVTTGGVLTNILINDEESIDTLLRTYLKRINREDLYNNNNSICFLFNNTKLKYGEKTKISQFFKNAPNTKVVVNDINPLIGA